MDRGACRATMGREGAKRSREVRVVWRLSLPCLCLAFCTAIHKRWQPQVPWQAGRRHYLFGKAGGGEKPPPNKQVCLLRTNAAAPSRPP